MIYTIKDIEKAGFEIIKVWQEHKWICCLAKGASTDFIFKIKNWKLSDFK